MSKKLFIEADISDFKQSQAHGLFWDNEIREDVFCLENKCKNDTKKYDIDHFENKFDNNENISIKVSGNNNIDCGDILRFYDGDFDKKYTILLLRYKQKEENKILHEIIEINYNLELRNLLFGTINREILQEYVSYIKSIPSGIVSDDVKSEYKKRKIDLQKKYNMRINISPKIDSHNQRRVQCSISKLDELLKEYPQFIISKNNESLVRGVKITDCLISSKRIRN